jgi:hypothetical protein
LCTSHHRLQHGITSEISRHITRANMEGILRPPRQRGDDYKYARILQTENALTATAMLQLYRGRGKLKSHKGWTHKNSVRQRDYVKTYDGFINPDGKRVGKITNLRKFSRGHGLTASHLIAVAHRRIVSHRGWTHRDGRERLTPKKHPGFIRPDGRHAAIINLCQFCRENGLSVVHMHNLKLGTRNIHKGWTWRPL